jgi:hypothetical protein
MRDFTSYEVSEEIKLLELAPETCDKWVLLSPEEQPHIIPNVRRDLEYGKVLCSAYDAHAGFIALREYIVKDECEFDVKLGWTGVLVISPFQDHELISQYETNQNLADYYWKALVWLHDHKTLTAELCTKCKVRPWKHTVSSGNDVVEKLCCVCHIDCWEVHDENKD